MHQVTTAVNAYAPVSILLVVTALQARINLERRYSYLLVSIRIKLTSPRLQQGSYRIEGSNSRPGDYRLTRAPESIYCNKKSGAA